MTKTELHSFQRTLESRRAEDRIQHASERDWAMGVLERDRKRLQEVRAALLRLEAKTFGVCVDCEGDIHPKRLAAVPWAALCIVCQEAADAGQDTNASEIDSEMLTAA
jgi:RNA polymerase-binding transcription factor DksA